MTPSNRTITNYRAHFKAFACALRRTPLAVAAVAAAPMLEPSTRIVEEISIYLRRDRRP